MARNEVLIFAFHTALYWVPHKAALSVNCNNNAIITQSVACIFDFYLSSAANERAAANVNSLGSQLCNRRFYSRLLLCDGIAFFTLALDKERATGFWERIFSSWQVYSVAQALSLLFVWFARRCVKTAVKSVHSSSSSFCAPACMK